MPSFIAPTKHITNNAVPEPMTVSTVRERCRQSVLRIKGRNRNIKSPSWLGNENSPNTCKVGHGRNFHKLATIQGEPSAGNSGNGSIVRDH